MMMTREDYYAQIKEMYVQKYESKDKEIEAEDRRFREYLMLRSDDDDETWTETDWWLRSNNNKRENLQVLSDSSGFNRPDPKPIYEIKADKEIPKASSKSKRRYKLQKRISCEELDERTMKGLCVFCEEPETPGHYLQHTNSCLLMIDSEDHLSDSMVNKIGNEISSDSWLSNSIGCELESGETDNDEDRAPSDSDLVVNDIKKVKEDLVAIDVDSETDLLTENNQQFQEQAKNRFTTSVMQPSLVPQLCSLLKEQVNEAREFENHKNWVQHVLLEEDSTIHFHEPVSKSENLRQMQVNSVLNSREAVVGVVERNRQVTSVPEWIHKKESEKERKWEDMRQYGSLQSYYDDQVKSTDLVVRDQTQEIRSDVVISPWVSVKQDGAVETQTCISRRANHVWKPGGFVHPKIQLDWLERADSNQEKESNKKLRKLKLHQGRKSHKTWMFKYKSEFPRHYGFDNIDAFFGVEFYEMEYKKLHINHCFAVQEFYGIHGSISGPWHLAFDPGGIISCTACGDFVVTHTQWVGHDKFEGCSNVQTLATDVDVEEKQAWIENAWFKIQVFSDFDINASWVGDDVKKGKNSFLGDGKIILALAVKEYMMGKANELLLPGHYGLLHTFDQCGGLNATVMAGTIMQSSLKLFHQLRVACLHHTSLGFLYGSLPRPPEENHSNFSNMLQYHETWSCISLRTNRVWDPGGSNSETD